MSGPIKALSQRDRSAVAREPANGDYSGAEESAVKSSLSRSKIRLVNGWGRSVDSSVLSILSSSGRYLSISASLIVLTSRPYFEKRWRTLGE